MALEVSKYDVLYGRLLKLGVAMDQAKALAKVLYDISTAQGVATDELLKYVTNNGLRFDNEVYALLNNARTISSQVGFIDQNNISPAISKQAGVKVSFNSGQTVNNYVNNYVNPGYVS